MTLLNSCQVTRSLALFGVMWQTTQLICNSIGKQTACESMWQTSQLICESIEEVSSPAFPNGGFRYMLSHIWSKTPNIVELG